MQHVAGYFPFTTFSFQKPSFPMLCAISRNMAAVWRPLESLQLICLHTSPYGNVLLLKTGRKSSGSRATSVSASQNTYDQLVAHMPSISLSYNRNLNLYGLSTILFMLSNPFFVQHKFITLQFILMVDMSLGEDVNKSCKSTRCWL